MVRVRNRRSPLNKRSPWNTVNVLGQYVLSDPYVVVHSVHLPRGARQLNKCTTTHGILRTYCPNTFTVFQYMYILYPGTFVKNN
jgi:hypothetical protein